ncbi:MAG TPA: glutamate--tRNA ligase [Limnochordia bacterium]|nr:glutamate--tRNA ligase [Limnochordia bacterium]
MTDRNSNVRVRIAPSPTGPIHAGTIHTALFNWLFARHMGGRFILRLEDTDRARSDVKWEEVIYQELRWIGLDWDEGPDVGGPYGPYRQTERYALYQETARRLLEQGRAYRCFCTPEELEADRKAAESSGQATVYSGRCRHLSEEQIRSNLAAGKPFGIRLRTPATGGVAWDDLIRGPIEIPAQQVGDFFLVRSNGAPLYNFAVVVDDITMKITHVLRGESHISNTPAQLLLYQALEATPPRLGHLGELLGANRRKLSKRDGNAYLGDYRERGYLPEALINFMALMGWAPPGDDEIIDLTTMIETFRLERVTKAASFFDLTKLEWLNGHYIRSLAPEELAERCLPFLIRAGLVADPPTADQRARLSGLLALVRERIKTLAEIVVTGAFAFKPEIEYDSAAVEKVLGPEARAHLQAVREALSALPEWTHAAIEAALRGVAEAGGLSAKKAFQPVRVATLGGTVSPPLFESLELIGREWCLARLQYAIEHLCG